MCIPAGVVGEAAIERLEDRLAQSYSREGCAQASYSN
jgi:hypothetical protein